MQFKMPSNGYEKHWFLDLMCSGYEYKEPILEDSAACVVKRVCDFLKQDSHVFIMSVEIVEEYILQMDAIGRKIQDPLLAVGCIVLLCSKFAGEQSDIQIRNVQECFEVLSTVYPMVVVTEMEREIFHNIKGKLPLSTKVDDLNTFIEIYTSRLKLKADIRPLCIRILEIIHISRDKLHRQLKSVYMQKPQSYLAFKEILCKKLFFPSGILLCAFRLNKHVINFDQVVNDISCITSTHRDHIEFLADTLYNLIVNMSQNEELCYY